MSDIEYNWITQSSDGSIDKFFNFPMINIDYIYRPNGGHFMQVQTSMYKTGYMDPIVINLNAYDYKIVDGILIRVDKEDKQQKHSHYKKDVRHLDYIDVYRIIELYELHDPCFQHALKKILVPGARGHKDLTKDINDIIDTMQRKIEMMAENEKKL